MRSCLSVLHVLFSSHTGVILFPSDHLLWFQLTEPCTNQVTYNQWLTYDWKRAEFEPCTWRSNAVVQCVFLVLRITWCTSLGLVFICISIWSAEGCDREDWKMKKFKRVTDVSLSLSPSLLIESKWGFASLSPCEIGRHLLDCVNAGCLSWQEV